MYLLNKYVFDNVIDSSTEKYIIMYFFRNIHSLPSCFFLKLIVFITYMFQIMSLKIDVHCRCQIVNSESIHKLISPTLKTVFDWVSG